MNIYTLPLGDYQTNCYIIHGDGSSRCCVIDPGYTPELVLEKLETLGLSLEAILLTHGHFDHVGGVKDLAAETGCRVYIHEADLSLPGMITAGRLYYTDLYPGNGELRLAGLELQVLHTPGHTPGSVCLLCQDQLFSGDTLFCGSCGRTDLPGGNWAAIRGSLQRLASLEKNRVVHPGHGESTTLDWEKKYNPYMR